jgi:dihydrofolate synthase/folylpolyglutamate synthase
LYPRAGGGTKWSLEPTRRLLQRLGHPESHFRAIHIGGTNAKGSVAAMVYAVLRCLGYRVALYTSPHLVDIRERMVVNDTPITRGAFASWTTHLRGDIETTGASFFEATTAIAFADFAARGADIAVIEVGLGGRLDSTNVLLPMVAAVTTVGVEHTEYLGHSLEAIAGEKGGIAKPGVPFVIGETDPAIASLLESEAARRGARIVRVPPTARYDGPLALTGSHQGRNAAVAQAILDELPTSIKPDKTAIAAGFASAWLPGRLDRRGKWVFDVAHNPSSVRALISSLDSMRLTSPLHVLLGVLADKDATTILRELGKVSDRIWVTEPPSAPPGRRVSAEAVAARATGAVEVEPNFDQALERVQRGAGTVLVTGSFHTVGDAMVRLPGFRPCG